MRTVWKYTPPPADYQIPGILVLRDSCKNFSKTTLINTLKKAMGQKTAREAKLTDTITLVHRGKSSPNSHVTIGMFNASGDVCRQTPYAQIFYYTIFDSCELNSARTPVCSWEELEPRLYEIFDGKFGTLKTV